MKQKTIMLIAIAIASLLTVTFFIGSGKEVVPLAEEEQPIAVQDPSPNLFEDNEREQLDEETAEEEDTKEIEKASEEGTKEKPDEGKQQEAEQRKKEETNKEKEKTEPKQEQTEKPANTQKQEDLAEEQKKEKEEIIAKDNENQDQKDKYLTDPVPEGKPKPVEWQDVTIEEDKQLTATLSVSAKTILNNMHLFNEDKLEVLPADGVIFPAKKVTFYEGESVFDVLLREMKSSKIHMEFVMTPIYNSHYIEGINNLYEFDCGELSGWMYKVNGWFPNYGASRYQLKDNDVIDWVYTCDLGRDIGGYGSATGGAG